MRILFGDAYYFVALLNRRDQHHQKVTEFANANKAKIVTTDWVLMEVVDALSASEVRENIRDHILSLRSSLSCEIIEASRELFDRALKLFDRHTDKNWSLTDCTSFIVMRDRGITEALTGDKHFEQAGFVPLFK